MESKASELFTAKLSRDACKDVVADSRKQIKFEDLLLVRLKNTNLSFLKGSFNCSIVFAPSDAHLSRNHTGCS